MYKSETQRKLYDEFVEAAGGQIYSVDKVVENFTLDYKAGQVVLDLIAGCAPLVYRHWTSQKAGSYKEQFSFETDTGGSFWLGVGLNTFGKPEWTKCRLEWNPNKVGFTREFRFVFNTVAGHAKYCDVKQFDLAVDIPVERATATLVKDARLYEESARSASDRTQYAGQRNAPGRVKLYNKTREAGLSENVTRMEITLAWDDISDSDAGAAGFPAVLARWPRVYLLADCQAALDAAKLSETDRFIFKTLLAAPERLPELGRRKREKFEALLWTAGGLLEFDPVAFARIAAQVAGYRQLMGGVGAPVFARKWFEPYEREITYENDGL